METPFLFRKRSKLMNINGAIDKLLQMMRLGGLRRN